ncbi:hypothetical protein MH1LPH_10320 [Lactiplantibacillus brownii]
MRFVHCVLGVASGGRSCAEHVSTIQFRTAKVTKRYQTNSVVYYNNLSLSDSENLKAALNLILNS